VARRAGGHSGDSHMSLGASACKRGQSSAWTEARSRRFVRFGQADAAEGVAEVSGQVLAVQGLETGLALPDLAESGEELAPDGVQLAEVHDHLGEATLGERGKEVPAEDPARPDGSPDVSGFQ